MSNQKIHIISNGINFNRIQKINSAKEKIDVIYAERLMDFKHIDSLIKDMHLLKEHIPTVKCLVIGDRPENKRLEALTQKLKLEKNIKFFGFLENNDDVYAIMKSLKVFILPSTREGFGIVVIEANASGIPVIAIDHKNNAARDLTEERKKCFVCQRNEEEITDKCMKIQMKNYKIRLKIS